MTQTRNLDRDGKTMHIYHSIRNTSRDFPACNTCKRKRRRARSLYRFAITFATFVFFFIFFFLFFSILIFTSEFALCSYSELRDFFSRRYDKFVTRTVISVALALPY